MLPCVGMVATRAAIPGLGDYGFSILSNHGFGSVLSILQASRHAPNPDRCAHSANCMIWHDLYQRPRTSPTSSMCGAPTSIAGQLWRHAARPGADRLGTCPSRLAVWPSPTGLMDRERPQARVGMDVHIPTLAVPYEACRIGGALPPRPQAPVRRRRSGGRGATPRWPETCGNVSVHIRTAVPCTCTSMSMCTPSPAPAARLRVRERPPEPVHGAASETAVESQLQTRDRGASPALRIDGSDRLERCRNRRSRLPVGLAEAASLREFPLRRSCSPSIEEESNDGTHENVAGAPTAPENGAGTG